MEAWSSHLSKGGSRAVITQEFHLSITPLGGDSYLLRTEDVALGVPLAEIQVDWPVAEWLDQSTHWYNDPLATLLSAGGAPGSEPANRLLLGKILGEAIFQGRLRDSWLSAQSVAQYSRKILRLRVGFKDSRLQRLPWELLYDSDRPLATGADLTFARYVIGPGIGEFAEPLPTADQALRILMVISTPNDQERLALRQEVEHLQADLPAAAPGAIATPNITIELTILEQPGRAELVSTLEQGQFQVFHYAGHSEVSDTGGDLYLVSAETGLTERLAGEDLAGLLVNNHIRLAVLNSCRGAYTARDDAETGWRDQNLVQALVNRGVPGVIAMAERIPDHVAATFTQLFYRNLRRGYPIDLSLSRTRQGLVSAFGSDQVYWMLPILYLHPAFDGYLYEADQRLETLDPWLLSEEELDLSSEVFTQGTDAMEADETAELMAFLEANDGSNYDEDAAVVTGLLQQLFEQRLSESTLPQSRPAPPSEIINTEPSPSSAQPLTATESNSTPATNLKSSPKPASGLKLSRGLAAGIGAGGAILGLTALFLTVDLAPRSSVNRSATSREGDVTISDSEIGDNSLVINAIAALNQGNTETTLDLGETLLDQGNLQDVETIFLRANPTQRQNDPYVAYLEGRWHWQNLVQGTSSAEDAMRAWHRSTEAHHNFVPAWVGLGFAQYKQGELEAAIETWQEAIVLDRDNLRDLTGNPQVGQSITVNAYAGLAMAYRRLSQMSVDPQEQADLLQKADDYFEQAISLDSALLKPYLVSWLWTPVVADWEETIEVLSLVP
ncbi:CHAT domain-containing protein [filamentous cyanobacterium CCP5]|nr:CHAT domain-containing protein [filamentous cyanobacterium CCP5]